MTHLILNNPNSYLGLFFIDVMSLKYILHNSIYVGRPGGSDYPPLQGVGRPWTPGHREHQDRPVGGRAITRTVSIRSVNIVRSFAASLEQTGYVR
jgi:hypothetical protein